MEEPERRRKESERGGVPEARRGGSSQDAGRRGSETSWGRHQPNFQNDDERKELEGESKKDVAVVKNEKTSAKSSSDVEHTGLRLKQGQMLHYPLETLTDSKADPPPSRLFGSRGYTTSSCQRLTPQPR
jgi:hypothetical protein